MSSPEGSSDEETRRTASARKVPGTKKRRVQTTRACDRCRQKKVRCNGAENGQRCLHCQAYNAECTFLEITKRRGPPKAYVDSLENRLKKMEDMLDRLYPDADFSAELGPRIEKQSYRSKDDDGDLSASASASVHPGASTSASAPIDHTSPSSIDNNAGTSTNTTFPLSGTTSGTSPSSLPPDAPSASDHADNDNDADADSRASSENEYEPARLLEDKLKDLSLDPTSLRYFGKSSPFRLLQTAAEFGSEFSGKKADGQKFWRAGKPPKFTDPYRWQHVTEEFGALRYNFPDPDLLHTLVDLYFSNLNVFIPLLHRPTFEAGLAANLHRRDEAFGGLVLLVCACASRFSSDPRVVLEGQNSWHSSGWQWFSQVYLFRKTLLSVPCLYDLQLHALTAHFLFGCAPPQPGWITTGIGIRLALDVGAHRKKSYHKQRTVEDELWKRAFWVLVLFDRGLSTILGRPCAISEEDFDVDLPAECDDEYWTHPTDPELAFKQPPGKPSTVSYFINVLKLNCIQVSTLRTVYSLNKSKFMLKLGAQWEQNVVAALDSELNQWFDNLPSCLRWDPTNTDPLWFRLSAGIYAAYYALQILIHRPFIIDPKRSGGSSPLSFSSLAICTNAARSSAHVLDLLRMRYPGSIVPHFQVPAFTSAVVLLVNIWGVKRSGMTIDFSKEMEDVRACIRVLEDSESRWQVAGRFKDILSELASLGELGFNSMPPHPPPAQSKRRRDDDTDSDIPADLTSGTAPSPEEIANISSPPTIPLRYPYDSSFSPTRHQQPSSSASGTNSATSNAPSPQSPKDIIDDGIVAQNLPTSYEWRGVGVGVPMDSFDPSVKVENGTRLSTMGPPTTILTSDVRDSYGSASDPATALHNAYAVAYGSSIHISAAAPTLQQSAQGWEDPSDSMQPDLQRIHMRMLAMEAPATDYRSNNNSARVTARPADLPPPMSTSSSKSTMSGYSSSMASSSALGIEDTRYFDAILHGLNGPNAQSFISPSSATGASASASAASAHHSKNGSEHHPYGNFGLMDGPGADNDFMNIWSNVPGNSVWDEWNSYVSGLSAEMPGMGVGNTMGMGIGTGVSGTGGSAEGANGMSAGMSMGGMSVGAGVGAGAGMASSGGGLMGGTGTATGSNPNAYTGGYMDMLGPRVEVALGSMGGEAGAAEYWKLMREADSGAGTSAGIGGGARNAASSGGGGYARDVAGVPRTRPGKK